VLRHASYIELSRTQLATGTASRFASELHVGGARFIGNSSRRVGLSVRSNEYRSDEPLYIERESSLSSRLMLGRWGRQRGPAQRRLLCKVRRPSARVRTDRLPVATAPRVGLH
jgi:hypothetical protein